MRVHIRHYSPFVIKPELQTRLREHTTSRSRRAKRARFAVTSAQRKRAHATLKRARGMPGARSARSPACSVESTRGSHHGHTGKHPAFPTQFLTVSFVLLCLMRGGNRTETIQDLNANGSERDSTVKVTSADGSSKTIQYDHAGTGTVDLTQISTIVRNADGSSVTTQTDLNGDKSLRDETVTTLTPMGCRRPHSMTTQAVAPSIWPPRT